ncbi:hypothetical protein OB955_00015 [Halobacteria archaeon AArc-m2/3/4]|uniref:Uncharacterized protein n=1 Tax=Natronoglomus mannanivorans TaxID=2979990 RepID=A0ABT2Q881_9EURY|nr:hypothetical protein [Halobacteria archaeon AArc-m2/3/4]
MGSAGSKLSVKERIGYEVFFFTAVYGLYNVFFSNPVLVDTAVFTLLFGTLFVRYHLVVSDEDLSDSSAARWTGTATLVTSVAITSHLGFKTLGDLVVRFDGGFDQYILLAGSTVFGVLLFAACNHPVFRYDEQRRETFIEKAKEDSPTGLIARIALFFDRQSERASYDLDVESSLSLDEARQLMRKQREGDITPEEHDQLKQNIKRRKNAAPILIVGFHALVSIVLLLVFTALFEALSSVEAVKMLSLILIVTAVYYSFLLLHTRFGLRREVSRPLPKMPMELILCILVTFATLSNTSFMGGAAVIIIIPFTVYLLTNRGGLISQKMILSVMKYLVDTRDDEYADVMREIMQEEK